MDSDISDNDCGAISCKLTTPEMQVRKSTVLNELKSQILEEKETADGHSFRFPGTDEMLDKLIIFIKTERQCCSFFTFNLAITNTEKFIWLELSGPEGAKEFIKTEMEL